MGQAQLRKPIEKEDATGQALSFGHFVIALLFVGAALRLAQFAIGAALWTDELAIARNLVEKPLRALLTGSLDYAQVAPRGFLLIEKLVITALGNNEYALRLFPLLCALVSLPLFAYVARSTLPPVAALAALTLFTLSPEIIGYGSQAKQYSTDIAATLLMLTLTLQWWEQRDRDHALSGAALLGATGLVTVWFSHAVVFALTGLGAALFFEAWIQRSRSTLRSLAPIAILWTGGVLGAIAFELQTTRPSTQAYMQAYWAQGFMPLPPRSLDDCLWLWRTLRRIFQYQLRYPFPAVGVLLMLLGVVVMARRRWHTLLLVAPLGANLLASATHQYPFGDRVSLFLLPSVLLFLGGGIDRVRQATATLWRSLSRVLVVLVIVLAVYALHAHYPMYPRQEMRDVLAYIQAHRQPGDAIYVYHGASPAVGYYGSRYHLTLQDVVIGRCPSGNPRQLLRELDQFRGYPRLWVIISHAVGPLRERETILGYLEAIGAERNRIVTGGSRLSSSAYLYDLSDPSRLRASSSNTYTLPMRERWIQEFPCPPGS